MEYKFCMNKQVLFIQGGGYEVDKGLVDSLREVLGMSYDLNYPQLKTDEAVSDFGWPQQIGNAIGAVKGEVILVGHSLGASMVLKYLSETKVNKKITGIFLLSTPFWSGNEDWKQGLKLRDDFADKMPDEVPIFLYHCRDDEEVPFSHLALYRQELTWATFHEISGGGHQLNSDLTLVARDIKSL